MPPAVTEGTRILVTLQILACKQMNSKEKSSPRKLVMFALRVIGLSGAATWWQVPNGRERVLLLPGYGLANSTELLCAPGR